MSEKDPYSEQALREEYARACAERDAIEKHIAPLREKLKAAADEAERYRLKAMEVARELDVARGGPAWFALKKKIGRLAKMLGGK